MTKRWIILTVLLASVFIISFAQAQTTTSTPNTPPATPPTKASTLTPATDAAVTAATEDKSGLERFRDWFHNPTDWLSQGADLRVRYTYGWNLDTLNDNPTNRDSKWSWFQNRARMWQKFKLTDDVDFNIRYTWEYRVWDSPDRKNGNGTSFERTHGTDFSEILFDQFNITARNLGNMPLTMVAGRQDIIFGEGWLVSDATPGDAARTAYFDALRFTYEVRDKTTLDMILVANRAAEDAYLAPINNRHRFGTDQDETGVILYLTDKTNPNMNVEGYFINKNDNPVNHFPVVYATGYDQVPKYWSRKANLYTFGGALSGKLMGSDHWTYRTEGAIQTGQKEGVSQNSSRLPFTGMKNLMAFGTLDKIEYNFNDKRKNKIRGTFEFLSGDNPDSGKIEQFDPLWGRWPRISETIGYVYNLETRVEEATNLYRFGVGHSINLTDKLIMNTDLNFLFADTNGAKNFSRPGVIEFSDSGKFRGTLATVMFKYQLSKNLLANLLLEYYQPGSYYASGNRDAAYFTRINLDYTF
jgi:hypothetical protein